MPLRAKVWHYPINKHREKAGPMKLFVTLAAAVLIAGTANSAACRDAKGKFIKCAPSAAAAMPAVTKDAKGKCHLASGPKKGAFTSCPKS